MIPFYITYLQAKPIFIYTSNHPEYLQLFPVPICHHLKEVSLYCRAILHEFRWRIQNWVPVKDRN